MFSDANTNRAWTRIHAALSKLLNKQAQRHNQSISTDRITSSKCSQNNKKKHFSLTYFKFSCTSRLRNAYYELWGGGGSFEKLKAQITDCRLCPLHRVLLQRQDTACNFVTRDPSGKATLFRFYEDNVVIKLLL